MQDQMTSAGAVRSVGMTTSECLLRAATGPEFSMHGDTAVTAHPRLASARDRGTYGAVAGPQAQFVETLGQELARSCHHRLTRGRGGPHELSGDGVQAEDHFHAHWADAASL